MSEARLKVLTFNTWGRTGPWAQRKAIILDGIRALEPDVIGLNEVWEDADGDLADELADEIGGEWHVHDAPAYELAAGRTCGNGILSRFRFTETEAWPLPEPRHDGGRNLVFAMIATPWGKLPVFVTHLSWMAHQGAARMQQMQQIRSWINERAPIQRGDAPTDTLPPILMGDMNTEPDSDEIRFVRGYTADEYGFYMADCFGVRGEGAGHTWHRDNVYAAREHYPNRRIDYIFVRGPEREGRGRVLSARLAFDRPDHEVYPSDHFGVDVELQATKD